MKKYQKLIDRFIQENRKDLLPEKIKQLKKDIKEAVLEDYSGLDDDIEDIEHSDLIEIINASIDPYEYWKGEQF